MYQLFQFVNINLLISAKAIEATKNGNFGENPYPLWQRKVPVESISTVSWYLKNSKFQLQFADLMSTTANTFR